MAHAKGSKITKDDVQTALERFKRRGGLIRRLPDEVVPRRVLVPARAAYETVDTLANKLGLIT